MSLPITKSDIDNALSLFKQRLAAKYALSEMILFGSRARQDHHQTSDVDVAVLLRGHSGQRFNIVLEIADIAFDVMLETGVLIEAIPFWESEWFAPETFSNPALIASIKQDGISV
jgi:predicted nucleotidyltransferase